MKQLTLFQTGTVPTVHLFVDGAARNNPGPAGAGVYIAREGNTVFKKGFFLGNKTNNQAEYFALLLGLWHLPEYVQEGEGITIFGDSLLLVRQMRGEFKVKDEQLKRLQHVAFVLLKPYTAYSFVHVYREENGIADEMANEGIDTKVVVPVAFKDFVCAHAVSL